MLTRKEATWLACKPKTCCYTSFVLLTGLDIWRISNALDVPPWSFIVYFESPEPRPDAFMLDKSGRQYRLALTKAPSRRKKSPPPCVFLLKTRDGHHRCGLGDLRPQVCKTFPMELADGIVCIPGATGCTCRAWSLADTEIEEEEQMLGVRMSEFSEYCDLVENWNASVMALPDEAQIDFYSYCRFVFQAYEERHEREQAGTLS